MTGQQLHERLRHEGLMLGGEVKDVIPQWNLMSLKHRLIFEEVAKKLEVK